MLDNDALMEMYAKSDNEDEEIIDESEEQVKINVSQALDACDIIQLYLQQQEDNMEQDVVKLRAIRNNIDSQKSQNMRQSSLFEYLKTSESTKIM